MIGLHIFYKGRGLMPRSYYYEGSATLSHEHGEPVRVPYVRVKGDGKQWQGEINAGADPPPELLELLGSEVQCTTSEGVTGTAEATGEYLNGSWHIHLKGKVTE